MMHGWGGSKTAFEAHVGGRLGYNDVFFAQRAMR